MDWGALEAAVFRLKPDLENGLILGATPNSRHGLDMVVHSTTRQFESETQIIIDLLARFVLPADFCFTSIKRSLGEVRPHSDKDLGSLVSLTLGRCSDGVLWCDAVPVGLLERPLMYDGRGERKFNSFCDSRFSLIFYAHPRWCELHDEAKVFLSSLGFTLPEEDYPVLDPARHTQSEDKSTPQSFAVRPQQLRPIPDDALPIYEFPIVLLEFCTGIGAAAVALADMGFVFKHFVFQASTDAKRVISQQFPDTTFLDGVEGVAVLSAFEDRIVAGKIKVIIVFNFTGGNDVLFEAACRVAKKYDKLTRGAASIVIRSPPVDRSRLVAWSEKLAAQPFMVDTTNLTVVDDTAWYWLSGSLSFHGAFRARARRITCSSCATNRNTEVRHRGGTMPP